MSTTYNRRQEKEKQKKQDDYQKKLYISSIKKLIRKRMYGKALFEIERFLEKYPNNTYGLFQKGSIYFSIGILEEAEKIFINLVENESESQYSSLYKLGSIELKRDNLDKAEEYFRRCIEESPYPELFSRIELSYLLAKKDQFEEAEKVLYQYFEKEKDPYSEENKRNLESIKLTLIKLNLISHNQKKAIEILDTIKEDEVFDQIHYWSIKADIERSLGHYDQSYQYIQKILSGPKTNIYWETQVSMASIHISHQEYEKAIQICNDVIKNTDSKDIIQLAKQTIARAYSESGDYNQAEKKYIEIIKDCKERGRNQNIGYIYLARMEYQRKNYEKTLEYYQVAENLGKTKNNYDLVIKTWANLKLGRYMDAYQLSQKVRGEYIINKTIENEFRISLIYLKSIFEFKKINSTSYFQEQLVEYHLDSAINHIKDHHMSSFPQDSSRFKFHEDIHLEELMSEINEIVQEQIPEKNYFVETYIIPYENIGVNINNQSNKNIKVVKLPVPGGIITMWPTNCEGRIRKIEEEPIYQLQKNRMSQIDKFNQKYNIV